MACHMKSKRKDTSMKPHQNELGTTCSLTNIFKFEIKPKCLEKNLHTFIELFIKFKPQKLYELLIAK